MKNYSDYTGVDVDGKLMLLKAGEPKNTDGTYTVTGSMEKSAWSNMSESLGKRVEVAMEKGAVGVLYYDADNFSRFKRRFDYMKDNDSGRMEIAESDNSEFYSFLSIKKWQKPFYLLSLLRTILKYRSYDELKL